MPTIFRVEVYGIDAFEMKEDSDGETSRQREYYPTFPLCCHHKVLSATLPDAEAVMVRLLKETTDAYCAVITELAFGEDIRGNYVSKRAYDADGTLVDSTKCSSIFSEEWDDYRHFRGRMPEEIRFKKGDIVEVFNGDSVSLAVVVGLPPSVERCYNIAKRMCANKRNKEMTQQQWEQFCFKSGYILDDTDDCYTVVDGPGYINHQHRASWHLFKPRFPIPKHIEDKLRHDYQVTIEEIS